MAGKQQAHGQSVETRMLAQASFMARTGQILAFLVVMSGLAAGTWLLANDKSLWGAAVTLTPFVSLAGLFVLRRRGERDRGVPAPAVPKKPEAQSQP